MLLDEERTRTSSSRCKKGQISHVNSIPEEILIECTVEHFPSSPDCCIKQLENYSILQ